MAKKKTAKSSDSAPSPTLPFEDALERLEELVETMEGEQLPLEKLISNYEEGNELLEHCQRLIDTAKDRIEVVQANRASKAENKLASDSPKGDTDSSEASEAAPPDDIRLF
jgi:exodeoxyribonuclease VII small subunit